MRQLAVIFIVFAMLMSAACTSEKGKEQLETARFEEKQNNREHAIKLYEKIVKKYPGSPNAKIAEGRLAVLKAGK
jgi:TolA-binding protein